MPYYKRFFETSFDLMCLCNKTHFLEINEAFVRLLGFSRAELLSRPFLEFIHPDDVSASRAATEARVIRDFENRYITRDRKTVWLRWAVHPDIDPDGTLHCVAKDITDSKVIATQLGKFVIDLQKSERAAKQAKEEAEVLAYAASHDLQEPLRTIMNWAAFLKEDYGEQIPPGALSMIDDILESATRGRDLVSDLLQLSRVGRESTFRMVDMNGVVDKAVIDLELTIGEAQASISRTDLPRVWGDASMLRQLIKNLLSNAIKFTKPGMRPVVQVSGHSLDGVWRFVVRDEGIGIEPLYASKVFGVFTRLDTKRPGTGIGLAICKKIVDIHDGRIWIESLLGAGATVHFTIAKPPSETPHEPIDSDPTHSLGGGSSSRRQAIRASAPNDVHSPSPSRRGGRGPSVAFLAEKGALRDRPDRRSRAFGPKPAQSIGLRSVGRGKR